MGLVQGLENRRSETGRGGEGVTYVMDLTQPVTVTPYRRGSDEQDPRLP